MLSMTGYGSAHSEVGAARITVEVRAVNHRFLDVRPRFPHALGEHAAVAEEVARQRLGRGRVELTARIEGSVAGDIRLDRDRARAAFTELSALRDELGSKEPIPLSLLSCVPELFVQEPGADREAVAKAVREAATGACDALTQMRRTEGLALAADLAAHNDRIRELTAELRPQTADLVDAYRERLRARIERLIEGSAAALDAGRLEHEVALLADRTDVSEELTRLESHCGQLSDLLTLGDEPVGRKLEFLLQEMGREVNTIGSKAADLSLTRAVLEQKAELERLREQVQNVL